MEVEYKKDLKHNYMVVTQEEQQNESYCIRMLENQALAGLLSIQQRHMDNKTLFYYDITGKQSMINLYGKASLSYDKLKQLIGMILGTIELAYEYLLPEDDFILRPEYIYLDVVTNAPSLCFLSGFHQGIKEQMSDLLEYLMNKVDYNDKEAVLLVYRLYAVSKEEGYAFAHMYEVLHKISKTEIVIQPYQSGADLQPGDRIQFVSNQRSEGKDNADNRREKSLLNNIPIVMERREQEEEVSYYPRTTYILTAICGLVGVLILILGFTTGILYNSYGERIEFGKLIGLLLIVLCVEGYLMRKLWNQENKLTRMVTKSEYIDPRQEYEDMASTSLDREESLKKVTHQVEPSQLTKREYDLWKGLSESNENEISASQWNALPVSRESAPQEDYNPTCLLSDITPQSKETSGVILKSRNEEQYSSINIHEFPFFIGKLSKNVDYCLENNVVSRYHAKLTMEEEKYYITDLNSTNGTFVNDKVLTTYERQQILQGDRIALANLSFEFLLN
ncbi:MAG: hypothetical protein K0R34_397 [Herbinix sp.]|nr:hypothetical protein [Herbinix sp.]